MRMENESIENICVKVMDFKLLLEAAGIIIHNPSELTEPRSLSGLGLAGRFSMIFA